MERLKDCNLEHCTPEEVGVNSSAITSFIEEINESKLGLHSFTVVRHDKVCVRRAFLNRIIRIYRMFFTQ